MTTLRVVLILAGLWLGWHGIGLLFDLGRRDLVSVILWFAGAILLHDAVFAPLCAATGLTARRYLPHAWWGPVACGAVCTVALLLITAPVLRRGGAIVDNPTVLDRDYPLGLAIAITLIWVLVVGAVTAGRLRTRRTPASGHQP
ncbi:hypothetical protein [Nocardia sp. NPDC005366]|uniref:hypothetical protein n=1 Tax=Nocardia sp. NPDC005366 TaxID=3156878 RepID=UPI0033B9F414